MEEKHRRATWISKLSVTEYAAIVQFNRTRKRGYPVYNLTFSAVNFLASSMAASRLVIGK